MTKCKCVAKIRRKLAHGQYQSKVADMLRPADISKLLDVLHKFQLARLHLNQPHITRIVAKCKVNSATWWHQETIINYL
jgi:hypothetical protein